MSSLQLTHLICWIFDGLEQFAIPWSMHLAGVLYLGVKSFLKMFGSFRFRLFRPCHRFRSRRRLPSWAVRILNWLYDFLIEALVIVGGSILISGLIAGFLFS